MHRIALFLRKDPSTNKFRRTILNTLRSPLIDEALICSGFFQDDSKYSAGDELDIAEHRPGSPLHVTVLGLYSYSWKTQYASFFSKLQAKNSSPNFSAVQKRIPSMGWHAKVFLAKHAGKPMVGIVGSSNITRRAFGELKDFNYECDVVMWDQRQIEINDAVERAIGGEEGISDVVVANYDRQHRANRMELDSRLLALESEILAKAVPV